MKTLTIKNLNGYVAKSGNNFIISDEYGQKEFWKLAIKAIKTFGNNEIEFYSIEKNFKLLKYPKTDLKRSLHTMLTKGNFTKSESLLLIEYFNFPKDKYLGEQLKLKFSNRKYPTGKAWQKEHYNIDHSNPREVNRKRSVPARNVRKYKKK